MANKLYCNMLTGDGNCSVYAVRPLVCRLFGAMPALPCPHGCAPQNPLTDEEASTLVHAILALSQAVFPQQGPVLTHTPERIQAILQQTTAQQTALDNLFPLLMPREKGVYAVLGDAPACASD